MHVANWYYLTGSLQELRHVWNYYGVPVETIPNGAMVAHADLAFVIDDHGRERDALRRRPGFEPVNRIVLLVAPPEPDRPSPRNS